MAHLHLRHPPYIGPRGTVRPARDARLTFPVPSTAWRDARKAIGHYAAGRPGTATFFHGPGDGSDPEDLNTCRHCGHEAWQFRSACPRCGGPMVTRRWARRFGGALAVAGLVIAGIMTVVLVRVAPMLAGAGGNAGGMRFAGSTMQLLAVAAILVAAWLFGASAVAQGAYQVLTGRARNRIVLRLWTGLGVVAGIAVLALVSGQRD